MSSGSIELRDFISTISKHRVSSYIVILMILIVWGLYYLYSPKYYEASSIIYVPISKEPFGITEVGGLLKTAPIAYTNQNEMAAYLGFLKSELLLKRLASRISNRSAQVIKQNTRIAVYVRQYCFIIHVRDKDPELAAKIANTYVVEVNKLLQENSLVRLISTRSHLKHRIKSTEKDLNEAEMRLEQFKKENRTVSPNIEKVQLIQQRAGFLDQLDDSKVSLGELSAKIAIAEKRMKQEEKMQPSSESKTTNPMINHLRSKISSIKIALASARTKYSEEHPRMVRLTTELAQAQKNLKKEVEKNLDSQTKGINPVHESLRERLVADLVAQKSILARITALDKVIKDLDQKIARYPDLDKKLANLQRQVFTYEDALQKLRMEIEEIKLQEVREFQTFETLDQARADGILSFPDFKTSFFVACIFSVFAGICISFIMEYLTKNVDKTHNRVKEFK